MNKEVVVISRQWDHPEIKLEVTDLEINISMSLEDFLIALTKEIGNPTFLVTQNMLLNKIKVSSDNIMKSMKDETIRIM